MAEQLAATQLTRRLRRGASPTPAPIPARAQPPPTPRWATPPCRTTATPKPSPTSPRQSVPARPSPTTPIFLPRSATSPATPATPTPSWPVRRPLPRQHLRRRRARKLATAHLQQNDPQGALSVLAPLANTPQAQQVHFRYALARAYQLTGDTARAAPIFRAIYAAQPFTFEASQSAAQLQAMGAPLSAAERKTHADALFNARPYGEAAAEYNAIGRDNPHSPSPTATPSPSTPPSATSSSRSSPAAMSSASPTPATTPPPSSSTCSPSSSATRTTAPPTTPSSPNGRRFPASRWLEEALYSGGNIYLLNHDAAQAIVHYSTLVRLFPSSVYAPSAHWRAAWMNYRSRNYAEAARLMDEQIVRYPGGLDLPAALYWRGRTTRTRSANSPRPSTTTAASPTSRRLLLGRPRPPAPRRPRPSARRPARPARN